MKKLNITVVLVFLILGMLLFTKMLSQDYTIKENVDTKMSELQKKYPIKSYHQELQLECKNCHENELVEDYEELEDESCLSCHKSKDYLAQRLAFMDKDKTNPHNSVHDGTSLSCYECHMSHESSQNMCADCHNIKTWMKEVE